MNLAALLPKAQAGATAVANTNPNPSNAPTLGAPATDATPLDQVIAKIQASAPATAGSANPASMSFDPQYEATKNQINAGLAGLQSSTDLSKQRTNEDYTKATDTAAKTNSQNLKNLQYKLSGQGIGYSGVNVAEQGRMGEDYQTQLGQLAQGKQRTLEDIARDFADKQASYQNQSAQNEIDRGNRETEAQKQQAADDAAALATKTTADLNRQWLGDLTNTITQAVQPAATPTGQMALPPTDPKVVVQKALADVPPPAAKTPQQQVAAIGLPPRDLQTALKQAGFDPGPIDGVIGIKSQQALARWKQSIGLPATADIDNVIWQALSNVSSSQPAQAPVGPVTTPQQLANNINNRVVANPQGYAKIGFGRL